MSDIPTYISLANSEAVIRRIIQAAHSSLNLDEIFERIVHNLGVFLQADRCFIACYDEHTHRIYPPSREYRSSGEISSILEATPELWESLSHFAKGLCHYQHPVDFNDKIRGVSPVAHALLESLQVQSGMGCMIRFQDECQAVLFIHQVDQEREWGELQRKVIYEVSEQAGIAINHADLYERLQRFSRSRELMEGLFRSAMIGVGLHELYEQALDIVSEIMEVKFSKIIERTNDPEEPLILRTVRGFDTSLVGKKYEAGQEPHSAYTLETREPVKVIDIHQETRFNSSPLHEQYGLISGLSAVIFNGPDAYGVLEVDTQEKRNFTGDEVLFLQQVANVLGLIAKRKDEEEFVRQTEERFRALVENIQDYAIYLEDAQGNITSWNTGAERIFGYTADEVIGQPFLMFLTKEEIEKDLPRHELEAAAREGRFETEGWRLRKDGSRFWANVLINALSNVQGELIGFSNITRDMTARKQAEQALQQSNRDLELFAAMASHDLKAPLRKVQFFSEHLYETLKYKLDEDALEDLLRIRKSVTHMQALVDDFLSLAKISRNDQPEFDCVDLFKVAHKVVSDFSDQIREKQARVEIEVLATVPGDPAQLEQLLQNLIGNSLKFQREGVFPKVVISSEYKSDQYCELRISDNGIGFPQEQAARIFEPLERLHGKSKYEGTGVGLAICKRVVERHGGSIEAIGIPGEGATFIIRLPIHRN